MTETDQIKKNFIIFLVGSFSCIYYYVLGFFNITILPYLITTIFLIINFKNLKFTFLQLVVLLFLTFYFVIVISYNENFLIILRNFQYWFGITFFLIFLNNYNYRVPNLFYRYLFIFLCLQLLLEAILVNSIPEIKNLHIYKFANEFFGFYSRPIGFAGSTSSSITIICALFCFLKYDKKYNFQKFEYLLLFLCLLLSLSHTGYIIFSCIFLYEVITQKKVNFNILFLTFISICLILILQEIYTSNVRSPINHLTDVLNFKYLAIKITLLDFKLSFSQSYDYYIANTFSALFSYDNLTNFSLTDLKSISLKYMEIPNKYVYSGKEFVFTDLTKINIIEHKSIKESFFGVQLHWPIQLVGGDFALLMMLNAIGIFGFFLYFSIIFLLGKNFKNLAFLILIIGSLHYGAIMTVCGQFVLALIISKNK